MRAANTDDRPVKTSVFLPANLHRIAKETAARNEMSTSEWIARQVAKTLGVKLAKENKLSYY